MAYLSSSVYQRNSGFVSARYAGVSNCFVIVVSFLCKILLAPYDKSGDTPQNGEQGIGIGKLIYSIYMQHSILPVIQALGSLKLQNNGR